MAVGRQFGREAFVYLLGFLGAGVIQFLAIPIYSRALGPEQYGYLTVSIAAATALAGVMSLGGDTALARFWADATTEVDRRALASTWIAFLAAWSVVVAAAACAGVVVLGGRMKEGSGLGLLLVLAFMGLVPTLLSSMLAQVLRNRFQPIPFAVSTVVVALLTVSLGAALGVGLDMGAAGIALGTLVGQALGCVLRFWLVRGNLTTRLHRSVLPALLRFGIPFVPASLAMWVFTGADRLVLGAFGTPSQLGAYGLAASLVGPFTVFTLAMGQAWIPRITAQYAADPVAAGSSTALAIRLALSGLGMAALVVGWLAPWVVRIVGGPGFEAGASALPALALGSAFAGTALFTSTGLTLTKRTSAVPVVTGAAAALGVLLLMILVPRGGVVAAAASIAVAYFVLAAGMLRVADRSFPLHIGHPRLIAIVMVLGAQTALNTAKPATLWVTIGVACSLVCLMALNGATGIGVRRDPIR